MTENSSARDPFSALRAPVVAVDPDPAFAAALRARVERALLAPTVPAGGEAMTQMMTTTRTRVSPYLAVPDARAAIAFYVEAFDAVPRGEPVLMPDGRVGHAEVSVGDTVLMLAEEFPEVGMLAPASRGGVSVTLHLEVADADAAVGRAVAAGAMLEREVADAPYGRTGVLIDPAGHRWMVQTAGSTSPLPARDGAGDGSSGREGDVEYATLVVPDAERARAFYGSVLGWAFQPGTVEQGFQVEGTRPGLGLWGGQDRFEVQLCYRVDDLTAALERVRAGGGSAGPAQDRPYGRLAECTDDQGMRFQLWEPPS